MPTQPTQHDGQSRRAAKTKTWTEEELANPPWRATRSPSATLCALNSSINCARCESTSPPERCLFFDTLQLV